MSFFVLYQYKTFGISYYCIRNTTSSTPIAIFVFRFLFHLNIGKEHTASQHIVPYSLVTISKPFLIKKNYCVPIQGQENGFQSSEKMYKRDDANLIWSGGTLSSVSPFALQCLIIYLLQSIGKSSEKRQFIRNVHQNELFCLPSITCFFRNSFTGLTCPVDTANILH